MILAIVLLIVGLAVSLLGLKMFRILLPLIGLVGGAMTGFIGFQSVFGKGFVSTSIAVFVAIAVGLILALLSYVFFELALWIYTALLGASAFSYLGIALGLQNNGFVLFLLGLFGFIVGAMLASSQHYSVSIVMTLTSFVGVAFILASVFLMAGSVTVDQLNETGVIKTMLQVVDQSFLWFFVWLGGSLVALQAQKLTLLREVLDDRFAYQPKVADVK